MPHGIVLLGSPRRNGSSDTLARHFMEGAAELGLVLEPLPLREYRVRPCTHCGGCQRPPHRCVLADGDDAEHILCALERTPFLLLAAPVYFYALPGQFKCLVDRAQSRWAAREAESAGRNDPVVNLSLLVAGRPRGEQLFAGSELCLSYFLRALGRGELTQRQSMRGIESPSDIDAELRTTMHDWGRQQAGSAMPAPSAAPAASPTA